MKNNTDFKIKRLTLGMLLAITFSQQSVQAECPLGLCLLALM